MNKVCSIVKSKHEEYPILWVGQGVNMQDPDQVVGEVQGDSEQLAGNLHEESSQMAEEYTRWLGETQVWRLVKYKGTTGGALTIT